MRKLLILALLIGALPFPDRVATVQVEPQFIELITTKQELPNFDAEVLEPLHARQAQIKTDCDGQGGTLEGLTCVLPPPPPPPPPAPVYVAVSGGLVGSIGYATCGGNCVNQPGVNNPGTGNPSNWAATSWAPWLGATALFQFNHTGVVVGIWSNGDLEIAHQNWCGGQHRFSRGMFRGFR